MIKSAAESGSDRAGKAALRVRVLEKVIVRCVALRFTVSDSLKLGTNEMVSDNAPDTLAPVTLRVVECTSVTVEVPDGDPDNVRSSEAEAVTEGERRWLLENENGGDGDKKSVTETVGVELGVGTLDGVRVVDLERVHVGVGVGGGVIVVVTDVVLLVVTDRPHDCDGVATLERERDSDAVA